LDGFESDATAVSDQAMVVQEKELQSNLTSCGDLIIFNYIYFPLEV
jgi:hypothetical protein